MGVRHDEVRTWYVFFCRVKGNNRWFHRFIKPEFGHVYLLSEGENKTTLKFEPLEWGMAITSWDVPLQQTVLTHATDKYCTSCLVFTVDYNRMPDWYVPRGIYTCVSAVKTVLGIQRAFFLITPFQLYKYLLKRYAIPVKVFIPYVNAKGNVSDGRPIFTTETKER